MDKTEFLTIYPTYENIDVVKQTLPSVIEETIKNNAKLIVHDSSVNNRDEKWEYLKKLNENNDFFLILSTNLSMASARNMCLALGQELYCPDYICMIEDDHGFKPGLINALVSAMKKYYGQESPNGLRYGMFSCCSLHTNATFERLDEEYSYPESNSIPFDLGGYNSCFRCAPTHHWNNVLKGYDTDEYMISEYQTKHLRWRNYHKGFTVLFVNDSQFVFDVKCVGRGMTSQSKLKLWDNNYCASDRRSSYLGKTSVTNMIKKKTFLQKIGEKFV